MVLCDVRSIEEGKCSSCIGGAFKARLTWVLENMRNNGEKSIADDFAKFRGGHADKAKFRRGHEDKSVAQLKEAIRQHVTIRRGTQSMQSHMAEYMRDEDELGVKYAKNPDKVTAIFNHAYSFYCPIRNCMLWADPDDVGDWNFTMTENKEQILNLDTNDSAKGTKRQKTEKAPPVEGDEKVVEGDEKVLNPVDAIKYKLFLEKIGEDVNKYGALVEEAYKENIPAKVMWMMIVKHIFLLEKMVTTKPILESCNGKEIRKMLLDCRSMLCEGEIRRTLEGISSTHCQE